jgi:hypothetical protein
MRTRVGVEQLAGGGGSSHVKALHPRVRRDPLGFTNEAFLEEGEPQCRF